jgi:hypothetical protein
MPLPIDWPSATYGSGTGTPYTSPNGDTWIWTGYSWEGLVATATPSVGTIYTKELISGGASWNSGMTFDVSALTYSFYGPIQSAGATQVTLSNGDAAYDRIDAIVVSDDDPNGIISVKEGVAAPNPTTPEISSDQLLVQYIIVPTGATTLPISTLVIYDNNTEWTGSTVDNLGIGSFNFASTSPTPYQSSVCLSVTGNNRRRWARFTEPTLTAITASNYALLSFRIYFTSAINSTRNLTIRFRNSNAYVGNAVIAMPTFASRTVTGQWQNVVIPVSLFSIPSTFDAIDFTMSGGNNSNLADWAIDLIQMQSGVAPTLGPSLANKPWAIYTQGTGIPNYYSTFAQAVAAAQPLDAIHLYGNVTEVISSPLTLPAATLNLNSNIFTIYGATGITGQSHAIRIAKTGNICDGLIIMEEYSGATGWLGATGAIINADGITTISNVWVENNTSRGAALKCPRRSRLNLICSGSTFQSNAWHGSWFDEIGSNSYIHDLFSISSIDDCHGIFLDQGSRAFLNNLIGYSTSTVGSGCGIKCTNSTGFGNNLIGRSSGDSDSTGIWIEGEGWKLKNIEGFHVGDSGFGGYIYGARVDNSKFDGSDGGLKSQSSDYYSVFCKGKEFGISALRGTSIHNSYMEGANSAIISEEMLLESRNCTFIGSISGVTGSNLDITHSYVETESRPAIELGPLGSTATEGTKISFNKLISIGATYGIDVTGATARNFEITQCIFSGPTASWNTGTITNTVPPSALDSQGNIRY